MSDPTRIYPVFLENAGCPERCVFCAQDRSAPGTRLDPAVIQERLEAILPDVGSGEIAFYGGSFTLLPAPLQDALLAVAVRLVAAGRAAGIRVSTRPDGLAESQIRRLVEAGATTVELGCQSFSAAVLKACRRSYDPGEVAVAVAALRTSGMRVGLQLMPGLPGADDIEARASLHSALTLRPDFLRIYPALVLRGTPLEVLWRQGLYRPWSLSRTIREGARLLADAHVSGVPVIRFGLQATPELAEHAVAGPYHPALGQLVKARLWYEAFRGVDFRPAETVAVHRSDLSDALGYKRRNFRYLSRHSGMQIVVADQVPRGYYCWHDTLYQVPGLSPAGDRPYDGM